ncbi:CHAT domain-containing protein [Alkalilacustris brevis]|uniref:CHAT domain-containing protein n=1 Tax=Alkalilacustris brevis TaxID=2026338 RepID=UPI000E0D2847|nr:CHAT domain-containing tetratricopeptide repeat protein [Alkalilacustris brevis]
MFKALFPVVLALALPAAPLAAQIGPAAGGSASPRLAAELQDAASAFLRAYRLQDWAAAVELGKPLLARIEASHGPAHPERAQVGANLAWALWHSRAHEEALQLFDTLHAEIPPDNPGHDAFQADYALFLIRAGQNTRALPVALAVAGRAERERGPDAPETLSRQRSLADLLRQMGQLEEAIEIYRTLLARQQARPGLPAAREAATIQFMLADSLDKIGEMDRAIAAYHASARAHDAAYGPEHPETLAVRFALARALDWMRDSAGLAAELEHTMPRIARVFGAEGVEYAGWVQLRAWQRLEAGDTTGARTDMTEAARMIAGQLPDNHQLVGVAYRWLCILLWELGDIEGAWGAFEAMLGAQAPDRKMLLDLLEERHDRGLIDEHELARLALLHLQGTVSGSVRGAVREQYLRGMLRDPELARLYRLGTDTVEERNAVQSELIELVRRPLEQRPPGQEAALSARHAELNRIAKDAFAQVDAAEPAFAALRGETLVELDALQAMLAADEAFVLIDHQRHDEEWSIVIAVTRDQAAARIFWHPVDGIEGAVAEIRDNMNLTLGTRGAVAIGGGADDPRVFPWEAAVRLFDLSFGQVSDLTYGKAHLYVEQRGPMSSLPPGLLLPYVPEADLSTATAPWLIHFHALTVLPSLTSLQAQVLGREAPRAPEPYAGFANPVFSGVAPEPALMTAATSESALRGLLAPLPETAIEARAVQAALSGSAGPQAAATQPPAGALLLGPEASEAALKAMPLDRYRVLHFATHGLITGESAGGMLLNEPALALTPGGGEDGFLTASEIAMLQLNSDWVVLSACNTALGERPGAEPLSGLAQAFIYAGARALLVSHWPVESHSAVQLMTDIFRLRAQHPQERAAETKAHAMSAMITDPPDLRWSHPAYWAPFILVGNPD